MMCVMMVCMVSCDSHKAEIEKKITIFEQALASNDSNTIRTIYPLAASCDSIDFSIGDADIDIEKGDSIGRYIAKLNDKELTIEVSDDGKITFVDSRNVLLYGKKKMDFAQSTGWIEEGMSDAQIIQRFADKGFINYLSSTVMKELNSNLQVLKWERAMDYDRMLQSGIKYIPLQFTVANNTPYDIAADDYVIEVGDYGFAFNLPLDASQGDVLCYDSYDDTIILRYNSGTSESSLASTKITLGNFADLTMTQDGSVYKYTVPSDGLNAADYHIQVFHSLFVNLKVFF